MAQYIDKSALVAEIETYISNYKGILNKVDKSSDDWVHSTLMLDSKIDVLQHIISFINTLEVKEVKEEPVSNDLEEAADKYLVEKGYLLTTNNGEHLAEVEAKGLFKAGAKWQKEQMVKGVDLEKELIIWHRLHFKKGGTFEKYGGFYLANSSQLDLAKHFFELGMMASNPITATDRGMAEEIIINLKRVEQDYCIDLTKEMEWLRSKAQKGG